MFETMERHVQKFDRLYGRAESFWNAYLQGGGPAIALLATFALGYALRDTFALHGLTAVFAMTTVFSFLTAQAVMRGGRFQVTYLAALCATVLNIVGIVFGVVLLLHVFWVVFNLGVGYYMAAGIFERYETSGLKAYGLAGLAFAMNAALMLGAEFFRMPYIGYCSLGAIVLSVHYVWKTEYRDAK